MPRITTTTTTEVSVSQTVTRKVTLELLAYKSLLGKRKALDAEIDELKGRVELSFLEAGEGEALNAGVKIATEDGDAGLKVITGMTTPKLDETKLMKRFKLTPRQLDTCRVPGKPKKPYLRIDLPKVSGESANGE